MPYPLQTLFRIGLFLGLTVGTWLATAPADSTSSMGFDDKLAHLLAFVALAICLDFSFPDSPGGFWRWKGPALMAYGFLIELIQYQLPTRSFSLADFVADVLGLLIYVWLLLPIARRTPLLRRRWESP